MQLPSFVVLTPPFIFHPEPHKINSDEPNNYVVSKTEFGPAILVFTDRDLAKQFMIAAATYHSSRDRDRLREEVIRQRGWTLHRIWSTEWFLNQRQEKMRLKRVLEAILEDLRT